VVYANGESQVRTEVRWIYPQSHWPIKGDFCESLKETVHNTWAIRDAAKTCDIVHTNSIPGLPPSLFVDVPFVHTIHHEHEPALTDFYSHYPDVNYVTISDFQVRQEPMPKVRTIHHGIDLSKYEWRAKKRSYLSFLGRIAPIKGPHLAIAVAQRTGIPLKIAGEIQPMFQEYFRTEIEPHIDGKFIEYVGEVGLLEKNELLANSIAMLFPIQWNEPFGLVMIEAMACGAPVLALPGGSVPEVVADGISGYVCRSVEDMSQRVYDIQDDIAPQIVREYAEKNFSRDRMAAEYERLFESIAQPASPSVAAELLQAIQEEPEAA
jgi:glycosyltransferase involved in cell wall biosynthesis